MSVAGMGLIIVGLAIIGTFWFTPAIAAAMWSSLRIVFGGVGLMVVAAGAGMIFSHRREGS